MSEISFEELGRMIGDPVYCERCLRRGGRHIVVGFLSDEQGKDGLTQAEYVEFDDPDHRPRYMPKMGATPSFTRSVALHCDHCGKPCGEWTAKSIRKRLDRGINTVP